MKFCFESEAWHEIFSGRDDGIYIDDDCGYYADDIFCDGDDDDDLSVMAEIATLLLSA